MNIELKILDKEFYAGISGFNNKLYDAEDNEKQYQLPSYATPGSAGVDLYATKDYVIAPQERVKIPTGIAIYIGSETRSKALVLGCVVSQVAVERFSIMGMIVPRSGLGTKGLVLANLVGTIDDDYQGELIISAWNNNKEAWIYKDDQWYKDDYWGIEKTIEVKAGDRIGQLIFMPIIKAQWQVVEEFSNNTDRGQGGFGSTGG